MSEIDRLGAGRELDALVAEKVMGWQVLNYDNGTTLIIERDKDGVVFPYQLDEGETAEQGIWWSPSTRMNEAWEVVEKLQEFGERGYSKMLECYDAKR